MPSALLFLLGASVTEDTTLRSLCRATLPDLVCCPGGRELEGKRFLGDLDVVARWHRDRLSEGLTGVIAYAGERPRGFAELMPAETAPFPIEAPGAAVLLCFHWAGTEPDDPEHLSRERWMLEALLADARRVYDGVAALGWDHPVHFPIHLLAGLGFVELKRHDPVALQWLPFRNGAVLPRLAPSRFVPRDLAAEGRLAIDAAWSARCPYSVSLIERIRSAAAPYVRSELVSFCEYRIDNRDEAFRLATSPWDWGWIYLNGSLINPFAYPGDALGEEIARRLPAR